MYVVPLPTTSILVNVTTAPFLVKAKSVKSTPRTFCENSTVTESTGVTRGDAGVAIGDTLIAAVSCAGVVSDITQVVVLDGPMRRSAYVRMYVPGALV